MERGIANACEALIGFNFEGYKIATRAANNDACSSDFHEKSCWMMYFTVASTP
jgi:hypothetical protein